jgi:hypothetical protein
MRVPVIFWVFTDSKFKKGEILTARLCVIRVMVDFQPIPALYLSLVVTRCQNLMNRMLPKIPMTGMNLVPAIHQTRLTIHPRPRVLVTRTSNPIGVSSLQVFPPTLNQNLIHV